MVIQWYADIRALGTRENALREAGRTWQRQRHALGYYKQLANRLGISVATLSKYARREHKSRPSNRASATSAPN